MRLGDELERRRLNDTFAALRALPMQPGRREAVALRVRNELTDMGFAVDGDPLAPVPASLVCALPGPPDGEAAAGIVLGARLDSDAALLLAVAHRARIAPLPCAVELLFTPGEEHESLGLVPDADAVRLHGAYGFFFDHSGPFGELVTTSPTTYRLEAEFHRAPDGYRGGAGDTDAVDAAARAVIAAVRRRAAPDPSVVVDEVPSPAGGDGSSSRRLVAVVRSVDEAAAEAAVAELVDGCYDAGNEPASACDVDVVVTRLAGGLRHGPGQPAVRVAEAALRRCGHEPHRVASDRTTDADRLTAAGVWCVSLARGTRGGPGALSADDLDEQLDLVLTLLDEVAA